MNSDKQAGAVERSKIDNDKAGAVKRVRKACDLIEAAFTCLNQAADLSDHTKVQAFALRTLVRDLNRPYATLNGLRYAMQADAIKKREM